LDLVSVSLTYNTTTSGSTAGNVLLVLNDKKSKEQAKLNGKTGASHVRKKSSMLQAAMTRALRP
jgi:hypothetical protein